VSTLRQLTFDFVETSLALRIRIYNDAQHEDDGALVASDDFHFAPETKALAYIVLALRYMFGLDDERELRLSQVCVRARYEVHTWVQEASRRAGQFVYMDWYKQLCARVACARADTPPTDADRCSQLFPCVRCHEEWVPFQKMQ